MISLREDIRNHPINSVTSYTFQDLQDDFNKYEKGIDELIKKYRALEDENVKLYKLYKSDELQAQRTYQKFKDCQDIQDDLKKLKGE